MSVLKTLFFVVPLVAGQTAAADPLSQIFASCTGRFSAELEHAWLMQDSGADEIARKRSRFEDLLAAVAPDAERVFLMDRRIQAKAAHAHMLSVAAFAPDSGTAVWAGRRAAEEIGYCLGFLLEG